jgi:hypothetical protein
MGSTTIRLEMGVIFCKYCQVEIDTFDAERVTTYYSDCQEQECLASRGSKEIEVNQ